MDFSIGKLVRDAGCAISRAVQFTEEKLGTADKTEFDSYYESLTERTDIIKTSTEKLLKDVEAVLVPNPALRVEDYIFDKIDRKNPNRLSNLEYLGLDMIDAGNKIGTSTEYGSALVKIGHYEQKLGTTERAFLAKASDKYTEPMQRFLNEEIRTIIREKNVLDSKRLDLDVCKNRVRKARTQLGLKTAERDMRIAQSEFDRQVESTKLLMEGIRNSYTNHIQYLKAFVEEQNNYYKQCHNIMTELMDKLKTDDNLSKTIPIDKEEFTTVSIL